MANESTKLRCVEDEITQANRKLVLVRDNGTKLDVLQVINSAKLIVRVRPYNRPHAPSVDIKLSQAEVQRLFDETL
jgi:hypothetical protein